MAAALHHDYGHEVLNVGQGFLSIVDSANQLFRGNVAGLQPDMTVRSAGGRTTSPVEKIDTDNLEKKENKKKKKKN